MSKRNILELAIRLFAFISLFTESTKAVFVVAFSGYERTNTIISEVVLLLVLVLGILYADKIAEKIIPANKDAVLQLHFEEKNIVTFGIVIVAMFSMLDSLTYIFKDLFLLFKSKSSSALGIVDEEYDFTLFWLYIYKFVVAFLIFFFRNQINNFLIEGKKSKTEISQNKNGTNPNQ